jgi:hypothetical protein
MSISRRRFIRIGTIAAVAAGISLKSGVLVRAQDLTEKGSLQAAAVDPLLNYTQATFAQYVNSIFRLRGFTTVDVTLMKVRDSLPAKTSREGGRESFSLHFRGGSVELPQDTYIVEHAALGTFRLFLVPTGTDENGAQGYVAVINRLAHANKPQTPRKPLRKQAPTVTPQRETKTPEPVDRPETKPLRRGQTDPESLQDIQTSSLSH